MNSRERLALRPLPPLAPPPALFPAAEPAFAFPVPVDLEAAEEAAVVAAFAPAPPFLEAADEVAALAAEAVVLSATSGPAATAEAAIKYHR
jgi:hypothetical protein